MFTALKFSYAVSNFISLISLQMASNKNDYIFRFELDFELATGPGDAPHKIAYPPVASSNWHKTMDTGVLVPRTPKDDFESLLFSIWTVADMKMDPSGKPESLILSEFNNRADAKSRFVVGLR